MNRNFSLITRRRALWVMGGLASSVALHACSQNAETSVSSESPTATPSDTASGETVSASTGSTLWIGYVPLFIALEKGFFEEGGLNLDYSVFSGNTEGDVAFAANQLDGVNNVTSEAVALFSKGKDFRIIQVASTSLGGDGILARNSIADISDFRGKEIAVDVGGVSHFFLLQVLKEAGLSGEDVTISNLTADAAAAAYQTGRIDVAVTYAPFMQKANEAQPDGRIIFDTSQMPTAIVDAYVFSPEFVEQTPDAAQAYVDGIYRAREFLETNKDEALAIAGEWLELTPEDVEQELQGVDLTSPEDNAKMLGDSSSDLYLVNQMADLGTFLVEQGQIESAPTTDQLEQVLEPKFVQAAIS